MGPKRVRSRAGDSAVSCRQLRGPIIVHPPSTPPSALAADPPPVWIIVPCYNEAERLPVDTFRAFIRRHGEIGFCFVNDGSTDATSGLLADLAASAPGQAEALDLPRNVGKAEAVRAGVLAIVARRHPAWVGYWDADLATPLEEIPRFMAIAARRPESRFILGARIRRMGARVERRTGRHYLGRVFATSASIMLSLPIYDTQCGAKLIEAELAGALFARPFATKWIFDVELIARTIGLLGREAATAALLEIPLESWVEVGGSRVRPIHFLRAPMDLLRIRRELRAMPPAPRHSPAREPIPPNAPTPPGGERTRG